MKATTHELKKGFTIVELLIVIVVIGILAAITIVAYSGVQDRAQRAKVDSDIAQLTKAVNAARITTGKTLMAVTNQNFTARVCRTKPNGTDLAAVVRTDPCWSVYDTSLRAISAASGIDVTGIVDPWGRPYYIDENEGEFGGCLRDSIAMFSRPFISGIVAHPWTGFGRVALSGNSGCN